MIAGVLFPLILKAFDYSIQTEQEYTATKLLYEKLLFAKKEGVGPMPEIYRINQTEYEIFPELHDGEGKMEVCIKYEDSFQKIYTLCEIFE